MSWKEELLVAAGIWERWEWEQLYNTLGPWDWEQHYNNLEKMGGTSYMSRSCSKILPKISEHTSERKWQWNRGLGCCLMKKKKMGSYVRGCGGYKVHTGYTVQGGYTVLLV